MKAVKSIFLIFTLFLSFSCSQNKVGKNVETNKQEVQVPEDLQYLTVKIDGMTCEIGCAKLIESKLVKTDGVQFAKIIFEEKQGNITIDKNKISEEELVATIQKIAGGELYKVASLTKVEKLSTPITASQEQLQ